jgi:16S rRNA processing protein RimM
VDAVSWDELAVVGRIARAHGIRGEVIVNLDTDFPEKRFCPGARLLVNRGGAIQALVVTKARFHHDRPVIGVEGIEDMNGAAALAGLELRVPRESLTPLPEGVFYRHDLVGCAVETTGGQPVGVVSAVEGDAHGSRLVVHTARGEALIPLAAEICTTIDPAARRIVINPPEGLLELNER